MDKFKTGDVVIKITGGNKMVIDKKIDKNYKCLWFVGTSLNKGIFDENEIQSMEDYIRNYELTVIRENRKEKINNILKDS